ncbi:uncharacterized protein M6B38_394450 [Iris pallida]|uniref:Uncharacterized protein n=1 Tax=Iris pallida TaxID=29817 RepID=A0AAX6FXJ6_IRIPA|nr:uncharacterized protein M6B38_394445 [Iris pallida]KAJ6820944.1 uncharacterized protein M6B38_394450 [Iris pallida]
MWSEARRAQVRISSPPPSPSCLGFWDVVMALKTAREARRGRVWWRREVAGHRGVWGESEDEVVVVLMVDLGFSGGGRRVPASGRWSGVYGGLMAMAEVVFWLAGSETGSRAGGDDGGGERYWWF